MMSLSSDYCQFLDDLFAFLVNNLILPRSEPDRGYSLTEGSNI